MQTVGVFDAPAATLNDREYDTDPVLFAGIVIVLRLLLLGSLPFTVTFDVNLTETLLGLLTVSLGVAELTPVGTL